MHQRDSLGKVLVTVGLLVLFHAAYSTAEWRAYTRKTASQGTDSNVSDSQESIGLLNGLPPDITMQTFIGLVVCMVGVLSIAGDFKEIRASIELSQKTWEHVGNRPSYYVYNHRAKMFSPYCSLLPKT